MPEIKQDLLGLQYSQPFAVEGMQEADINLSLSPRPVPLPPSTVR